MKLQTKFLMVVGIILTLIFVGRAYIDYKSINKTTKYNLQQQAEKVRSLLMSVRRVYHHQFINSGITLTEKTVGFLPAHALGKISEDYPNWDQSGFTFNNVSDKPRNPKHAADQVELEAMDYFRENPAKDLLFTPFQRDDGEQFYLYARPIWVEEYCLKCHGERDAAPDPIRRIYSKAWDYQVGELRGVLSIKLPVKTYSEMVLQSLKQSIILELIAILTIFIFITLLIRHHVVHPLSQMVRTMQEFASGNYTHRVMEFKGEFGILSQEFNKMADQIYKQQEKLKILNEQLEQKVNLRTTQLNKKITELTRTREELIHSEKMAALGQLVAGIAHEVNTPLGAIRSSAETLSNIIVPTLEQFPKLFNILSQPQQEIFFTLIEQSLQHQTLLTTKEKRVAKKILITELERYGIVEPRECSETFICLGISTNIEQYLPLLQHTHKDFIFEFAYHLSTFSRSTGNIRTAVERASKVIFALKTFARYDSSGEKIATDLQSGIETILTLYSNQIKYSVNLIKKYEDIPQILAYPNELNQVWTNLIHNALQAMNYKGTLTISLSQHHNEVIVAITDNGSGMTADIQEKIFMPFFTTKAPGEGNGLGLDIVKKIIDNHDGQIKVDSEVGKGTCFSILLPITESVS